MDTMDPATRVGNYQRLRLTLEYEFLRAARYGHPLSCVIVRVEPAKSGEGVAEPLLVEIVDRLKASLRGADLLFRFDAERFAVLLPETDGPGARSAVQRMILSLRTGEAIVASRRRLLLGAASYPQPAVATYDALVRGALSAADRAAARSETPFAASE